MNSRQSQQLQLNGRSLWGLVPLAWVGGKPAPVKLLNFFLFLSMLSVLASCAPNHSDPFFRVIEEQIQQDPEEEQDDPSDKDEEDPKDDDEEGGKDYGWVPGPIVEGEVMLLGEKETVPYVGASVSEFNGDGEPTETDEEGRFAISVENQDPWSLYVSGGEEATPAIWMVSLDALQASGMSVQVDLLERAVCKDVWTVDFEMDWAEDRGAIIALIWNDDGTTQMNPEMTGLSISVDTPGAEQWGLNGDDELVPVDGLLTDASQTELWLAGIPAGTHTLSWTAPPGYDCFAPEEVPVLGRTNTWIQMGCQRRD
jgi:hypothetical protein